MNNEIILNTCNEEVIIPDETYILQLCETDLMKNTIDLQKNKCSAVSADNTNVLQIECPLKEPSYDQLVPDLHTKKLLPPAYSDLVYSDDSKISTCNHKSDQAFCSLTENPATNENKKESEIITFVNDECVKDVTCEYANQYFNFGVTKKQNEYSNLDRNDSLEYNISNISKPSKDNLIFLKDDNDTIANNQGKNIEQIGCIGKELHTITEKEWEYLKDIRGIKKSPMKNTTDILDNDKTANVSTQTDITSVEKSVQTELFEFGSDLCSKIMVPISRKPEPDSSNAPTITNKRVISDVRKCDATSKLQKFDDMLKSGIWLEVDEIEQIVPNNLQREQVSGTRIESSKTVLPYLLASNKSGCMRRLGLPKKR